MKLYGLRETSGRLRVMFSLNVLPTSVRLGSVTAAVATTSTMVVVPATGSATLTVVVAPAVSTIAGAADRSEAGRRNLHFIGAERQHGEPVQSVVAGSSRLFEAGVACW